MNDDAAAGGHQSCRDGTGRAARSQNRRAEPGQRSGRDALLERPEEPGHIRVRPGPALGHANGVDRAHTPCRRIDLVHPVVQRHLVWNRDAGAFHADRARERQKIVGGFSRHRHVHGIDAGGTEARVVHRRRDRVGDRAGRKPVHVGLGVDRPEVIFVKQRGDRQLADLANRTRVGPPRPETPGQHTRRQAVIAHSDEDETALPIRSTADVEQARAIRQPLRRD